MNARSTHDEQKSTDYIHHDPSHKILILDDDPEHVDYSRPSPKELSKQRLERWKNYKTNDERIRVCPHNGCSECRDSLLETIGHLSRCDLNSEESALLQSVRDHISNLPDPSDLSPFGCIPLKYQLRSESDEHPFHQQQDRQQSETLRHNQCRQDCFPSSKPVRNLPQVFSDVGKRLDRVLSRIGTWRYASVWQKIRNEKTKSDQVFQSGQREEQCCREKNRTKSWLGRMAACLERRLQEIYRPSVESLKPNDKDHGGREKDPQLKTTDDEPSRASDSSFSIPGRHPQ